MNGKTISSNVASFKKVIADDSDDEWNNEKKHECSQEDNRVNNVKHYENHWELQNKYDPTQSDFM